MLYYGYFRSTDTSIDPKGHLYKVEIFTNFGNEEPYPLAELYNPPMPIEGIELTMCENPFVVSYSSDNGNIYKSYKCSTATVTFMLDRFNTDFFTSNSNRVMVALLKKNYNIVERNDRWYDNTTGEDLGIRKHSYSGGLEPIYKYTPSELDRYCYDVEWVGFATPNAYNQSYSLVRQPFELECQDAISTLQYIPFEYDYENSIYDVRSFLTTALTGLNVIRNVYITSNIRIPDNQNTTFLRRIIFDISNFRDEEHNKDRAINTLEVLGELMKILNLTMIQIGDRVFIVQYDSVLSPNEYYYNYLNNYDGSNYYFNQEVTSWDGLGLKHIHSQIELMKNDFAGSDTSISINQVYSDITVGCTEKELKLLPDLKQIKGEYTIIESTGLGQTISQESFNIEGAITCAINERGLKTHGYSLSTGSEIQNYTIDRSKFNNAHANVMDVGCGCVYLRDSIFKGEAYHNSSDPANPTRARYGGDTFLFFNYMNFSGRNTTPLLTYQSPKIILNYNKFLEISGDITTFRFEFPVYPVGQGVFDDNNYTSDITGSAKPLKLKEEDCYFKAKLSATFNGVRKWFVTTNLSSSNWNSGMWQDSEGFVYLPYYKYDKDGRSDVKEAKPFGTTFSFQKTTTNSTGLRIPIDVSFITSEDCLFDFKLELIKPYSGGYSSNAFGAETFITSRSAIIQNLDIKLVDTRLTSEWGYEFADTIYSIYENDDYIDNKYNVDLKFTSNEFTKYLTPSYIDSVRNDNFTILNNLTNLGNGISSQPEKLILANLYNQYSTPRLTINTTIHLNTGIRPYSKVNWLSQFPDKNFIVDSMSMNYEYNKCTIGLVEKVISSVVPEIELETYLKGDNGYGLIPNPLYDGTPVNIEFNNYDFDNRSGDAIVTTNIETGLLTDACMFFYPSFDDGTLGFANCPKAHYRNITINEYGELIIYKDTI